MKRFGGSLLAIILGVLFLLRGFKGYPLAMDNLVGGATMILAAFAYRSAKQRRLGLKLDTKRRRVMEVALLVLVLLPIVVLSLEGTNAVVTYPWSIVLVPVWSIVAFIWICRKKNLTTASSRSMRLDLQRLEIRLPLLMGLISLPLTIWDIHNQRVAAAVGMGWDMGGPPLWPYQTPHILLQLINLPAYIVAQPIVNLLRFYDYPYLVIFPATLAWWWFLGNRSDHGLVGTPKRRHWFLFALLSSTTIFFVWAATIGLLDSFHWWFRYGSGFWNLGSLIMVRSLSPAIWSVILACLAAVAAKRLVFLGGNEASS